ncbi:MAG: hypothetical protein ACM3S1_03890 [Hyphomicrobiales bacterium]
MSQESREEKLGKLLGEENGHAYAWGGSGLIVLIIIILLLIWLL